MEKWKNNFKQLNIREQRLVILSAILILFASFYWGIWSPLNVSLERSEKAGPCSRDG